MDDQRNGTAEAVPDDRLIDVHVEHEGDTTVVVVSGELDLEACPRVAATLSGCHGDVVLDAEGLRFICSSGLAVLVGTANHLEKTGGRIRLRRPSPVLVRLLHLTSLDDRFPIEQAS